MHLSEKISAASHLSPAGSVFLWSRSSLYMGHAASTSFHVPYCVKVCVAIHGNFRLCTTDGKTDSYRAAIIPSGLPHRLDGNGATVATLRWNPDTTEAHRLILSHSRGQIVSPPWDAVKCLLPRLRQYLEHGCSAVEAAELSTEFLCLLTPPHHRSRCFDSRIASLLAQLQSVPTKHMTAHEAAALTNLSASRFMHLFRKQVGLSFRRYQLGLRLQAALQELADSKSLTELAHKVGFADAAHLTRTARLMLGQAPSSLFAHQWWVQK